MDTFTINSISVDGVANVTFSVDKKIQKLDVSDYVASKEALLGYLNDYAITYAQGLDDTKVVVAPEVTAIVGKAQTVVEDPVAPVV